MRARYYNPLLMRFINADPIGFAGGSNWYAYANNSPLLFIDPSGLCGESGGANWLSEGSWQRNAGSFVAGAIPFVGSAQSVVELFSGRDYISGEETSRGMAAVGIVAGAAPGGKAVVKGGVKVVKGGVEVVAKYGPIVWRYTTDFVSSSWNKLFGKTAAKSGAAKSTEGAHTIFRRDPVTGKITHYETKIPQTNPRNPNPWQVEKRVDIVGDPQYNKVLKQDVPTPHVHDPATPGGVRPALPSELPK
jgi:hypothetical protein